MRDVFAGVSFPPQIKSLPELEEERAIAAWNSIANEVKRFRSKLPEGGNMLMTPSLDPSFRIVEMRRHGEYMILNGLDGDDNEVRVVQHRSQFNVRLVAVQPQSEPVRGAFGFMADEAS
jgi:hypothetical protein